MDGTTGGAPHWTYGENDAEALKQKQISLSDEPRRQALPSKATDDPVGKLGELDRI